MRKIKILIILVLITFTQTVLLVLPTSAQVGFCDLFPCGEDNAQVPVIDDPNSTANSLLIVGLSLFFSAFIGFGLLVIVRGALKIITAQAVDEKVEEGYKSIRAVFIGLGLTFVGIIGIAIVIALLGGGGLLNANLDTPDGIQNIPLTN